MNEKGKFADDCPVKVMPCLLEDWRLADVWCCQGVLAHHSLPQWGRSNLKALASFPPLMTLCHNCLFLHGFYWISSWRQSSLEQKCLLLLVKSIRKSLNVTFDNAEFTWSNVYIWLHEYSINILIKEKGEKY